MAEYIEREAAMRFKVPHYYANGVEIIEGEAVPVEYIKKLPAADVIEELAGFVQEAERDRDEYRERLDKANDAIEQLTADLERSREWEAFWEKEANEALKKFQTTVASMPRWIPVTERKPKTDDIVIVAIHDDSGDTPYDVTNVGFYLDVFPLGVWVVENERCNDVTHWMPLPSPPVEE